MPQPPPFPMPWSTPLRSTAIGHPGGHAVHHDTPSLVSSVTALVAIAAERSRASGDLATLRAAIDAVLDQAAREEP
jgi:hypothetical protein